MVDLFVRIENPSIILFSPDSLRLGNEDKIVNPDCQCVAMLNYIKDSLKLDDTIDLATLEGEVLDLTSHLRESARQFVEDRGSYYVVKAILDENEDNVRYVPVYEGPETDKIKFSLGELSIEVRKRLNSSSYSLHSFFFCS
jgi:hypothetical protein